jgi:nucleotide-binding universal stress UspA family protein
LSIFTPAFSFAWTGSYLTWSCSQRNLLSKNLEEGGKHLSRRRKGAEIMFRRILVPLDGSAPAQRALAVAAQLAHALDGTLILVRVVQPPLQPATSLAPSLEVEEQILSEELERATTYLTQMTQQPELAGIRHETAALVGFPTEKILDAVDTHQADSIILCSHGRTGLLRWTLGSVAQRVVHHALVPVLLLHQQGPALATDAHRPVRALIPLDGSKQAEAALGPAAMLVGALAPQGQGILHLVQVVRLPAAESEAALREAEAYLNRTAETLRKGPLAHLQVTWSAIPDKDIAGALVDLAQSGQTIQGTGSTGSFDLIAMATQGQGGLQRWLMGSVTERVLSGSKLPLLVVRPKAIADTHRFNAAQTTNEAVPS